MNARALFRGWLVLILLSLVASLTADEIRLGAWNVEQLGSPDQRSEPGRNVAQKPEDLAAYIAKARVDVLALEEIGDTDGLDWRHSNDTLDQTFKLLNDQTQQAWKYLLFPKKHEDETFQLTGVAWNEKRVQAIGAPYRIGVIDDPADKLDPWQRQPHAVKFSAGPGQTDFVVVPLHLKSNVGGAATAKQRAYEARALVRQLVALRSHFIDEDIVLLGDTNCLTHQEEALQVLTAAGFRDLNAGDTPTTYRGGPYAPAAFDRILVPGNQPEFQASKLEVLAPPSDAEQVDHKQRLSDHFMVITTIAVTADDDPFVDVERDPAFHALTWMQTAAEYRLAARQAYRLAVRQLEVGLADKLWTADLKQLDAGGFADKPPAVILDADETVLDNSAYNARLVLDGATYTRDRWHAWVLEQRADAVPGAGAFLRGAVARGVKVFYITNRTDDERDATIGNLQRLGLPADADTVLTLTDPQEADKVARRAFVAGKYRIVLLIGDNLADFCCGMNGYRQADRNDSAEATERLFGERWIVLPNPVYGDWQRPLGPVDDKTRLLQTKRG
jgi:5'-nucleotidase (lipoprotein e(P4) family)